jgi:hypothetical protein
MWARSRKALFDGGLYITCAVPDGEYLALIGKREGLATGSILTRCGHLDWLGVSSGVATCVVEIFASDTQCPLQAITSGTHDKAFLLVENALSVIRRVVYKRFYAVQGLRVSLLTARYRRLVLLTSKQKLTGDYPVVRKQYCLSKEEKQAVREWSTEMLAAGMIRQSKSPFSSPTFCIHKAVGWRIVHDFRAINARVRIPATPVPRKEDIYDAMAQGRLFSAMGLLCFFSSAVT